MSDVRDSIPFVHIRKFCRMHENIVRFRFFFIKGERSISVNQSSAIGYQVCI